MAIMCDMVGLMGCNVIDGGLGVIQPTRLAINAMGKWNGDRTTKLGLDKQEKRI